MTKLDDLHRNLEPISAFLSGSYNKFVASTKKHIPLVNAGAWLASYMKEQLVESKAKDEWINKMLIHLGQMNHVREKQGVMTMTLSAEERRELIAQASWEFPK